MRFDRARALHDTRRLLRDILLDQLRERRLYTAVTTWRGGRWRDKSWYACAGLARECIAGLRLLDALVEDAYILAWSL